MENTEAKSASSRENGKKGGRPVDWYRDKTATGILRKYYNKPNGRVAFPIVFYINTDGQYEYSYHNTSQLSPKQHTNLSHLIGFADYDGDLPDVEYLRSKMREYKNK